MKVDLETLLPVAELSALCRRWKVADLSAFGSVLGEDFGPESDVDLLVSFSPDARWTLFDLARMRDELQAMLSREVDLVSRRGVEASRNPLRRQAILSSARRIYAA